MYTKYVLISLINQNHWRPFVYLYPQRMCTIVNAFSTKLIEFPAIRHVSKLKRRHSHLYAYITLSFQKDGPLVSLVRNVTCQPPRHARRDSIKDIFFGSLGGLLAREESYSSERITYEPCLETTSFILTLSLD